MSASIKSFKDLQVWQKSADLAVLVYKITEQFPRPELYGITSQMRRAAVSISSNFAEGFKRSHQKEKLQFYNIAYGSASELESQIEISKKLGFLSDSDYQALIVAVVEVAKMSSGLIKSLNTKYYILNSQKGFSLLELLIYVVLIAGLTMIIASTVVILNRSRGATEARAEVNTNLRFAIEKISQDIQSASAVTTPSSTTTPTANTLVLTIGGSPVTYDVASGVLRRNGGQITASTTLFATPTFTRRENKNYTLNRSMVTIKVNLSASYNDSRPDWQYSATKETAIDMRMQ